MLERRQQELDLVKQEFGEITVGNDLQWIIIKSYKLPPGWNKSETAIYIAIPPAYPTTPPDNFHTDQDLRLANGNQPGNTTASVAQLDRQWLQFSYHVEPSDWRPHPDLLLGHNLLTFLQGVKQRLSEAS